MTLKVLASGSSGNGYVLYNGEESLVIECGVSYETCLRNINFDRASIKGALVSHIHGDHCKFYDQFIQASIPIFTSRGTIDAIKETKNYQDTYEPYLNEVRNFAVFNLGGFKIMPFDTEHDCPQPIGFLIHHDDCGTILFATDTYYLKYKFDSLNHIMIECNYAYHIIDANVESGKYPKFVRNRVVKSHMSLSTLIKTLGCNDLRQVNEIVLLHLSSHNSDAELFTNEVVKATGKVVHVAKPGLTVQLSNPF